VAAEVWGRRDELLSRHDLRGGSRDGFSGDAPHGGIVLGRATTAASVGELWRRAWTAFAEGGGHDVAGMELISLLAGRGPTGLLAEAERLGYTARPAGYAGRRHLCWEVRRWLLDRGHYRRLLAPATVYRP